jgi:hypothetical protein
MLPASTLSTYFAEGNQTSHRESTGAEEGAVMLVARRLAGLSAREAHYAGLITLMQTRE